MGKIVVVTVVTMVLPQEQSLMRLMKCEFPFRLKPFSESQLRSGLGQSTQKHFCTRFPFLGAVLFAHVVGHGGRGFSLAVTVWLRSHKADALHVKAKCLPCVSTEVQQKLDCSRGGRVKEVGTGSAILLNESSGHLARSHKLEKVLFYLGDNLNSLGLGRYCQRSEISPSLLSGSWMVYEQMKPKVCLGLTILTGTLFLCLLELLLMLHKAGRRAQPAVREWEIIFCD